jgi:SHS2 domain-containing protein
MSYEFLEDIAIADIAFRAWGENLEEVFKAASDATVNAMIDNLDAIELKETRTFSLENDALDLLLFNFLQEFIYYKATFTSGTTNSDRKEKCRLSPNRSHSGRNA